MSEVTTVLFTIGVGLIIGGVYFLLAIKKPGVFPPKYILKKRAVALTAIGTALLILGIITRSLQ